MQIILDEEELKRVVFSCRHICDRLNHRKATLQETLQNVSPFGRKDMYWIECTLDGLDLGPLLVEPLFEEEKTYEFGVYSNYCKVNNPEIFEIAKAWFLRQPEYEVQKANIDALYAELFVPNGGLKSFYEKCKVAEKAFMAHKISVIRKYLAEFDALPDVDWPKVSDELDAKLAKENVYQRNVYGSSGRDHLVWVYRSFVKNR